ncbi:MAG: S41 family peptidase [Exilispira sp.]
MDRNKERLLFIFIISLLIIVIVNQAITNSTSIKTNENSSSILGEIEKIIKGNYYINPPSDKELYEGAARGMVEALNDPFSSYVTQKELMDRQQSLSHRYGGIGAYITIENNMPMILRLIPNSPAKKIGILPGDVILEVDNKSTKGLSLDEVTSRIKGKEGTVVRLKIQRYGFDSSLIYDIKREIIKLTMVKSGQLTKNIFYIKIEDFGENTADTVKEELVKAIKIYKGAVIDLRGNPGGYLSEVVKLLDYFFKNKLLVYTKGRNTRFDEKYSASYTQLVPDNFKLVVLVDSNTASAAEIFTGVMKDYKRAIIIGEKTFGKGVVQQVFSLSDGSAVFLTINQYFTPKGYEIHKNGIEPDINVKYYQYSDRELAIISSLQKRGILYQYIQKYGTNNKEILYREIKRFLEKDKLYLSDTSIRFLVSELIKYYGEEKLFDLEFDYPLQKAIDQF